jgi:hypothetical protein
MMGITRHEKILFIGQEPETVDFSDPALPPGFVAKKINAGIDVGMSQLSERGWYPDLCLVRPDSTAAAAIERQLSLVTYDCVVIGRGVYSAREPAAVRGDRQRRAQIRSQRFDRLQNAPERYCGYCRTLAEILIFCFVIAICRVQPVRARPR